MKVYEIITNKIIEQLDNGCIPWNCPWDVHMPMNLVSKKEYRGVNILLLSFTGFKSPYFLTYKQAEMLGGNVVKGQKGFPVVYWNTTKIKKEEEEEKAVPFLLYHTVFNVEQCNNIPVPETVRVETLPIENCEAVITGMPNKTEVVHGGDRACYSISKDMIYMPHRNNFHSIEQYYGTLFHEEVHATGHATRLNRKSISKPNGFGGEDYSKEELIAEIGASFLCAETGISSHTIENQTNYIGNWLKRLRDDKRLIVVAACHAQKAVDYILNRNQGEERHEGTIEGNRRASAE
jgi:antirestriction protein ArdC